MGIQLFLSQLLEGRITAAMPALQVEQVVGELEGQLTTTLVVEIFARCRTSQKC